MEEYPVIWVDVIGLVQKLLEDFVYLVLQK